MSNIRQGEIVYEAIEAGMPSFEVDKYLKKRIGSYTWCEDTHKFRVWKKNGMRFTVPELDLKVRILSMRQDDDGTERIIQEDTMKFLQFIKIPFGYHSDAEIVVARVPFFVSVHDRVDWQNDPIFNEEDE